MDIVRLKTFGKFPDGMVLRFRKGLDEEILCLGCKLLCSTLYRDLSLHGFCRDCFERNTSNGYFTCLIDGPISDNQVFEDESIWDAVKGKEAYCPFDGCDHRSELQFLQRHITACTFKQQYCPTCKRNDIPCNEFDEHSLMCKRKKSIPEDSSPAMSSCPYCKASIHRRDLVSHLRQFCPERELPCNSCRLPIKVSLLEEHLASCNNETLTCDYCQLSGLTNDELQRHYNHCTMKPELCKLVGCNFTGTRNEMQRHRKMHLTDLSSECSSESRSTIDGSELHQIKKQVTLIQEQNDELRNLQLEIASLREQGNEVNRLKRKLKDLEERKENDIQKPYLEEIKNQTQDIILLKRKMELLEERTESLRNVEVQIASVKTRSSSFQDSMTAPELKYASEQEVCIRLPRYSVMKARAKTGEQTFFAKSIVLGDGYNLLVWIFPNGDVNCKNTHLALAFRIEPGNFDDFIKWPFDQKLQIAVKNQKDSRRSFRTCVIPTPKAKSEKEKFRKPKLDAPNKAFGFTYLPLRDLEQERNGFLVNDSLVLSFVLLDK